MAVADRLNRTLAKARKAAETETEPPLIAAYRAEIRKAARAMAARFEEIAGLSLAAAASWNPPTVADVTAVAVEAARIRGAQRSMLAAMAGTLSRIRGVDFDLTHPVSQTILDTLGARVGKTITAAAREPVAHAIATSWAKGQSVPDTAREIRAAVSGVAEYKATMLARTDLIGMSNGAGHLAVDLLNAGAARSGERKPIATKTWTNAGDSRVRPTHQEAEGQTVPIDSTYRVGTASLSYPGDPSGPDEEVLNCRCVSIFNETAASPTPPSPPPQEEPTSTFASLIRLPDDRNLRWRSPTQAHRRAGIEEGVAALDAALPRGAAARVGEKLEATDGKLSLDLKTNMRDAHGEYIRIGNTPVKINVSTQTPHPFMTTTHELGHWIDHQALSAEPGFATQQGSPRMRDLLAAFEDSAAIKTIRETLARGSVLIERPSTGETIEMPLSIGSRRYLEYLVDPVEIWARGFSQWIARTHGSDAAKAEVDALIDEEGASAGRIRTQWRTDDFREISTAIEAVLRDAGLVDDGGLTAALWRHVDHVDPRLTAGLDRRDPVVSLLGRQPELALEVQADLVVRPSGITHRGDVEHAANDTPAETTTDAGLPSGENPKEDPMPSRLTEKPTMQRYRLRLAAAADTVVSAEPEVGAAWYSDVAFEGLSTGDGRYMAEGSLGWRDLPLTLMALTETTQGGHLGALVAGRMDTFEKRSVSMTGETLPDGVTAIYATGVFDVGDIGAEIERMVDAEVLRGVSIDMSVDEWAFRDPETGELHDPDTASDEIWDRAFMGEMEFAILDGTILAATVVPTPAFEDARIAIVASGIVPLGRHVWYADTEYARTVGVEEGALMTTIRAPLTRHEPMQPLVASGEGVGPLRPPREMFETPETREPCPITIDDDGRLYGHLALWDSCHTGFLNGQYAECVRPPRSMSGYADFHLATLLLDDGSEIEVGRMTFDTGHAPLSAGRIAARSHYDNSGSVGAYVRATDGKLGIWVSGVTRSALTDDQLRDFRACPPSGDWRDSEGHLELQAALAVPVPGFPIRRSQVALAADGAGVRVMTLILAAGADAGTDTAVGEALDATIEADLLDAAIGGPDSLDTLIQGCDCE